MLGWTVPLMTLLSVENIPPLKQLVRKWNMIQLKALRHQNTVGRFVILTQEFKTGKFLQRQPFRLSQDHEVKRYRVRLSYYIISLLTIMCTHLIGQCRDSRDDVTTNRLHSNEWGGCVSSHRVRLVWVQPQRHITRSDAPKKIQHAVRKLNKAVTKCIVFWIEITLRAWETHVLQPPRRTCRTAFLSHKSLTAQTQFTWS